MFVNSNNYKLGQLDDGLAVDNVELPPWASSPQVTCLFIHLFVYISIINLEEIDDGLAVDNVDIPLWVASR